MAYPETPATLLSRLQDHSPQPQWQDSWRKFFDLYHAPIEASVRKAFAHHNWHHIDETLLEETISLVVVDFYRGNQKAPFDPSRGRLRSRLMQLAQWRVVDQIRRRKHLHADLPLPQEMQNDAAGAPSSSLALSQLRDKAMSQWIEEENQAYRTALLQTLIKDVRDRVSPRNWLIFDLVKLQHRPPEEVAKELRTHRAIVDNAVYKVMQKFRELASQEEYRQETIQ